MMSVFSDIYALCVSDVLIASNIQIDGVTRHDTRLIKIRLLMEEKFIESNISFNIAFKLASK